MPYERKNISWSGASNEEGFDISQLERADGTRIIELGVWDSARPRGLRAILHPIRWRRGRHIRIRLNP